MAISKELEMNPVIIRSWKAPTKTPVKIPTRYFIKNFLAILGFFSCKVPVFSYTLQTEKGNSGDLP